MYGQFAIAVVVTVESTARRPRATSTSTNSRQCHCAATIHEARVQRLFHSPFTIHHSPPMPLPNPYSNHLPGLELFAAMAGLAAAAARECTGKGLRTPRERPRATRSRNAGRNRVRVSGANSVQSTAFGHTSRARPARRHSWPRGGFGRALGRGRRRSRRARTSPRSTRRPHARVAPAQACRTGGRLIP